MATTPKCRSASQQALRADEGVISFSTPPACLKSCVWMIFKSNAREARPVAQSSSTPFSGTNDFLGSVNNWTETGITCNNAPANNTNTVNVDTNRAFVAYTGETLMFVEDLSTGSLSDTVYNVPVWRDMSEANRQTILNALNTGERKLTLGLQYVSSQATIIGFRSRTYGVESSIPRINVTFAAAPTVAPVVIQSGGVNGRRGSDGRGRDYVGNLSRAESDECGRAPGQLDFGRHEPVFECDVQCVHPLQSCRTTALLFTASAMRKREIAFVSTL